MFDLNFPRASKQPPAKGVIKQRESDFFVEECFFPELSGQGEHVWLWIEKTGQNTEFVAEKMAQFCKVKNMDIGFSGLKDRWGVTRQWFSVYLGMKDEPDWSQWQLEGVKVLSHQRHAKKLRRGEHQGNRFELVIRELKDTEFLEEALNQIAQKGFPNYFGIQRFGFQGANLERGERFFKGLIKASRSQRSFYLSAARSYLFNMNLAVAIRDGSWCQVDKAGPLYGDPQRDVDPLTENELCILNEFPVFAEAIHKNRLKLERRLYRIIPKNFSWKYDAGSLNLSFELPSGCFATSLLAECIDFEVGLGAS